LKLSDNLLVKAKFPKVEEDIETRELKIREDMQIIFEYVYGIKSSVAIIMANMNIKDETIEEFCEKYGLTGYLPEAKKLYSEISAKSIEFDSGNIRASVKIDGKYYRETKFTN
jgi:MinD superfamily P-loop ATPase